MASRIVAGRRGSDVGMPAGIGSSGCASVGQAFSVSVKRVVMPSITIKRMP
ncbi:hypothetical protein D3C78_1902210 [compost metagenome]